MMNGAGWRDEEGEGSDGEGWMKKRWRMVDEEEMGEDG